MENKILNWLGILLAAFVCLFSCTANGRANDNESAREDRLTGGRIERAKLEPGNKDIFITVDVPAFLMTLWQGDKEIAVYHVGVGLKEFPISIGESAAEQIILNPDWIPPDSDWVREAKFTPYKPITAKDPRNPLGKIKIPLGYGYLLHEAKGVGDLGSLVSHGCVRVLRRDLFDLSKKIAVAYNLPTTDIDKALYNKTQRVVSLGAAFPVDVNYDTMVVERGVLHIYPDVYEHETNTVENLRAELKANGVNDSKVSDATLQKVLARVKGKQQFVVALKDVQANLTLTKGKFLAVVSMQKARK